MNDLKHTLDAKSPDGPIETAWERHIAGMNLVAPANRRKHTVIVVGTGLAGGAAADPRRAGL